MGLLQRTRHSFRTVVAPTEECPSLRSCLSPGKFGGAVSFIGCALDDPRLGPVFDPMKNGMVIPMGINRGLHTKVPIRMSETRLWRSSKCKSDIKAEEPMVPGSKDRHQPHDGARIDSCNGFAQEE